jgi:hypothetical protein
MGKKDASVQPGVLYRIDRQLVHPAEGFLREISLSKTGHIDVQAKKTVQWSDNVDFVRFTRHLVEHLRKDG